MVNGADDTLAIQQLFDKYRPLPDEEYSHFPFWVYFPAGTYILSGQITINGCCITIFGDGVGKTVFKVPANSTGCQGAPGSASIFDMIGLSPNKGFKQYIFNITIDIGPGNPGCNAINYLGNNSTALRNVQLISEDSSAYTGLDLTSPYQGPETFESVEIWGFERGINLGIYQEYNATFENITLEGQAEYGIYTGATPYSMENLLSNSTVPAIYNSQAQIALISAEIYGGSNQVSAIESNIDGSNPNAAIYLYHIRELGSYGYTVYSGPSTSPVIYGPGNITEGWTDTPQTLFGTSLHAGSLKLPVKYTPRPNDRPGAYWCQLSTTDPTTWQAAMVNCGANATVYLPPVVADIVTSTTTEIVIPANVNHIQFFTASIQPFNEYVNLVVSDTMTTTPLIIEGGSNLQVTHSGTRPVVLVDSGVYYTSSNIGEVFGDDTQWVGGTLTSGVDAASQGATLTFNPGQKVWMRDFDVEAPFLPKVNCNGCTLWALGMKSENVGTVLSIEREGQSEILGAEFYRNIADRPPYSVLLQGVNSNFSIAAGVEVIGASSNYGAGILINEICNGIDKRLAASQSQNFYIPLFHSIGDCMQ